MNYKNTHIRNKKMLWTMLAILCAGCVSMPGLAATDPKYLDLSVERLHAGLQDGSLSCTDVVSTYLERIARLDKAADRRHSINAMRSINGDALAQAAAMDADFKNQGAMKGPLYCVPIVVKDALDVQGLPTTGGSRMLANAMPLADSEVVRRLKAAGAIILGKTNMTELAANVVSWNSWTGRIGNPYNVNRDVGGSSGGSGAAVAADFSLLAIGEDTGGSVRIPSTNNMLVGLRPTVGLISRIGLLPLSDSFDTPGPMARTVADVAAALDVLAGQDPRDARTMVPEYHRPKSYATSLRSDGLQGKRIGVLRSFGLVGPINASTASPLDLDDVNELTEQAIADMAQAGAEIVDPVKLDRFSLLPFAAVLTELPGALDRYRSGLQEPYADSLLELNYGLADPRMRFILLGLAAGEQLTGNILPAPVNQQLMDSLLAWKQSVSNYVASEMDRLGLDVLVFPSVTQTAPRTNNALYLPIGMEFSPITGGPSLVVPTGFGTRTHMPMSIEIHGRRFDESRVLEVGYAYEQATHHRQRPDLP